MAVTGPYVDDGTPPARRPWMDLGVPAARRAAGTDRVATDQSQRPHHRLFQVMGFASGLGRPTPPSAGPPTRETSSRHAAGGGDRHRSVAARDLRYPAGHPALTAGSGEASRVHWTQIFGLLFAALVPLGALILMLATGLESTASFVVVAAATVSVIVLALARMWRLVDQVRLTEQRGTTGWRRWSSTGATW